MSKDFTEISLMMANALGFKIPKRQGNKFNCGCMFHKDNSPSCSINFEKAYYHCFSCGEKGSLFALFKNHFNQSAYTYFNQDKKDYEPTEESSFDSMRFLFNSYDTPNVSLKIEGRQYSAFQSEEVMDYLKKRGFPTEYVERYKITYTPELKITNLNSQEEDNFLVFRDRFLIPIKENKRLLSIEARVFKENNNPNLRIKKVLYPKGGSVSTLFEWEQLDCTKDLYITEGLMDLLYLRTSSFFKNSTTLFGASISDRQIYLLNKFKKVIYIRNNDDAGKKSFEKICKGFLGNPLYELIPPTKDINDIYMKLNSSIDQQLDNGWLNSIKKVVSSDFEKKRKRIATLPNLK